MSTWVQSTLAGIGFVLFVIGYIRRNRNLMLLGAIGLIVGLGGRDAVEGFKAGYDKTVKH